MKVRKDDTVICRIDEYRNGELDWYDGTVISQTAKGVNVVYLSGHHSRNDFVEWKDIYGVVDLKKRWTTLRELGIPFSGCFRVNEEFK